MRRQGWAILIAVICLTTTGVCFAHPTRASATCRYWQALWFSPAFATDGTVFALDRASLDVSLWKSLDQGATWTHMLTAESQRVTVGMSRQYPTDNTFAN